jgi:hypothetical protein
LAFPFIIVEILFDVLVGTVPPEEGGYGSAVCHRRKDLAFIESKTLKGCNAYSGQFYEGLALYVHVPSLLL